MKTVLNGFLTQIRAGVLLALVVACAVLGTAHAATAEDRTLYIHYTHTGETARITFKRNGRYDQAGLRQLNQFLRDWRRNEPTNMDPALFDLVWSVYQEVGATQPIHVVSAYRAPETNDMLRSRSSGVAKNSRHTQGMAMDFYIPGISLSKLRETAMKFQVGGVGYYPTSGSPFVHLDTGNVRAWPRMTTAQLRKLFPDGKTLHLGADGTVLSQQGRNFASAEWQKCHSVPCVNGNQSITQVSSGGSGNGRTLLDMFFGGDNNQNDAVQVASVTPTQRNVSTVPVLPPVPASRNTLVDLRELATPPVPVELTAPVVIAARATDAVLPETVPVATALDQIAVASITPDDRPAARILLSNQISDPAPVAGLLSAYAPTPDPEPDAQRALEQLIERRGEEVLNPPQPQLRGGIVTASLGGDIFGTASDLNEQSQPLDADPSRNLFASTFSEATQNQALSLQPRVELMETKRTLPQYTLVAMQMRNVQLVEPDLDHVDQAFVEPIKMNGSHFAVLFEPDAADISPETELGAHTSAMQFSDEDPSFLPSGTFATISPIFTSAQ